ncbi:hypothetical protein ACFLXU_02745 [Chloroflexota bacterium]
METIKNLIDRYWRTGILFAGGLVLISYIAFGFLYLQQGIQQKELEGQIIRLSAIIAKPLSSDKELRADYDEANLALAPMTDSDAIALLVSIAEKSEIDTTPSAGEFRVPSASFGQTKVGGSTYQVLSFRNIHVQGNHENVMAFISDLDSGKTLETMELQRVNTKFVEIGLTSEDEGRMAEFSKVAEAAIDIMIDNNLLRIPNPVNYSDGIATNLMGDNPDTEGAVEGFPDITTTAAERGYSGSATPRDGYVLYSHDKIFTDNTSDFETKSYIDMLTTKYYYTCEDDATVRQFDGADVNTATEYLSSETSKMETIVAMDVNIYMKTEE